MGCSPRPRIKRPSRPGRNVRLERRFDDEEIRACSNDNSAVLTLLKQGWKASGGRGKMPSMHGGVQAKLKHERGLVVNSSPL